MTNSPNNNNNNNNPEDKQPQDWSRKLTDKQKRKSKRGKADGGNSGLQK